MTALKQIVKHEKLPHGQVMTFYYVDGTHAMVVVPYDQIKNLRISNTVPKGNKTNVRAAKRL